MILSYKKQFPWGKSTDFKRKILEGSKIHTIREDPHGRWRSGKHIHHAHGVRTKNYDCFLENDCISVQSLHINYYDLDPNRQKVEVIIDGEKVYEIHDEWLEELAINDGFGSVDNFFKWFDSDFHGKIVHWTPFKY